MTSNRLRLGALAWLLTLQFFVVETLAQWRAEGPYSRVDDMISALGATDFPAHRLMNASFVVQGALVIAGAWLLRPALRGAGARVAPVLLTLTGVGALLAGVFPQDANEVLHRTGAVLYLLGGGLSLIALAYSVRRRSEAFGTALAVLGLVGTAMTAFFLTGVTEYLGEGGTERAAAYVLPIGLALTGAVLWRMGAGPDHAEPAGDVPTRRQERDEARARRAEQRRLRDEALDTAARRHEATHEGGREDAGADDTDDPWATRPPRHGE